MDQPDFAALLESITCCNLVYDPDQKSCVASFQSRGYRVLGYYSDDEAQAIAVVSQDNQQHLCIAGTRVSEGTAIETAVDVSEDVMAVLPPVDLGGGAHFAKGALLRARRIWGWACKLFDMSQSVDVSGHSLGADTTHAMPAVMPPVVLGQMIAWEPPRTANDGYWTQYGWPSPRCITILHGRDFWAYYPWPEINWQGLKHPPGPLLWIHDGTWEWTTRDDWYGEPSAMSDHDTDAVMASVATLARQ